MKNLKKLFQTIIFGKPIKGEKVFPLRGLQIVERNNNIHDFNNWMYNIHKQF